MRFFEKTWARLVGSLRNAGAGPPRVLSSEISEAAEKTPDHDGQWLIGLGAKTQTEVTLPA